MECLGFSLLDEKTLFVVVIVMILSIVAGIYVCFYSDNGSGATSQLQVILFLMVTLF